MVASLRRLRRGVSSLISASSTATGFVVSLAGATEASAGLFLATFVFLAGCFFFTVRFLVCPSTLPATIRIAIASMHNLIRYFFIVLIFERICPPPQRATDRCYFISG